MDIPESENDNEPTLSDFNKYMIIPDIADKVIFLHRNRVKSYASTQDAKLIVAKNISGYAGSIPLKYSVTSGKYSGENSFE